MKKKRTPPWLIGGLVLVLLTVLTLLQSSNLWKNFSVETASDSLLLFALSSLNFIAFTIFAFILLRSLLKLSRERRALTLGAKIKTRLLVYFIGLSILPIIAMFAFSYLYLNRAVERWLSQLPENVLNDARKFQASRDNELAQILATLLADQEVTNQTLTRLAEAGNLTFLELVSPTKQVLAASERSLDTIQQAELEKRLGEPGLVTADLSDGRQLIIVPALRPESNIGQSAINSLRQFDDLKAKQYTIRQFGLTTLGLLTFLLIFASSWTAFYVARGLTAPIKALAEGSDEIAKGNFSHRVDVLAEDELALLVNSFNQMSSTLEANSIERKERRRYIETVLETLLTGVISFDSDDKITTINKAAIQMLRLENADFKHFSLEELVGTENRAVLEKLINRAKRIGQASEQTVLMREQNGEGLEGGQSVPVAVTASALPDKNGIVLVIEDLTELIQAQRASAWQEVARRMAHEIKNPLTPIQLSAERIAKRCSIEGTENQSAKIVKEGTETILREVSSLKAMVDEFSKFARLPNVKLENGNLNDLITQTASLYIDRKVAVLLDLAADLPLLLIDEEQLKRVFVNLIENSIEAFDEKQEIKQIKIKTEHNTVRDTILVTLSDNGSGISKFDFPKLFQPYFSTKGRGTGLGLAIVQRIVAEHGGKIWVNTNFSKGAEFILELNVSSSG